MSANRFIYLPTIHPTYPLSADSQLILSYGGTIKNNSQVILSSCSPVVHLGERGVGLTMAR
jgi:hypothetical protein